MNCDCLTTYQFRKFVRYKRAKAISVWDLRLTNTVQKSSSGVCWSLISLQTGRPKNRWADKSKEKSRAQVTNSHRLGKMVQRHTTFVKPMSQNLQTQAESGYTGAVSAASANLPGRCEIALHVPGVITTRYLYYLTRFYLVDINSMPIIQ